MGLDGRRVREPHLGEYQVDKAWHTGGAGSGVVWLDHRQQGDTAGSEGGDVHRARPPGPCRPFFI